MAKQTFYEILGVPSDASKAEIDKAFAERVEEYGGFDEVPERMHAAYLVLKSPTARRFYDWFVRCLKKATPIECDDEEEKQIKDYCAQWGYELVFHPEGPPGTWLIQECVARPPDIPKQDHTPPRSHQSAPEPPTADWSSNESTIPWPPQPLILGTRIYHWGLSHGRILDIVRGHSLGQFQVEIQGEPDLKTWKLPELLNTPCMPGDRLEIVSLCEKAATNRWTYICYANLDRSWFNPLSFLINSWIEHVHYSNRPQYFGVRNQKAVDQLLEKFFYELAFNGFRLAGHSVDGAQHNAQIAVQGAAKARSRYWKRYHQQR